MTSSVFDTRPCTLGEGPLWHPERNQLFWFDIIGKRLLSQQDGEPLEWQFDEHFSAAGWVDHETLLLASETGLWRFDIASGAHEVVAPLEADKPRTRSNDGRADPFGGFWIGTMGKEDPRQDAGAIYRFYDGVIEPIFFGITIPNAICFSPDGRSAYFADTPTQMIMRQPLDAEGWPMGEHEVFVDLTADGLFPDGAVVDAQGYLWNAQWGASRVARYAPDGRFDRAIAVGGQHSSCPAFGGADLDQLFVTTAREAIAAPDAAQGLVYTAPAGVSGQKEYRVKV
ncbi:SMP-30/gluconolactonase/LRE family protein [Pseudooceanicola sediminis]|uniref:SMP-30/gluconolactonase/LRE family protein n=1 Tax=Pseudooceanicola sediminis TaxID=2211117 RepID=A0A399J4F5_9RHOB|nr:SMP-30/gluconolactonase/LRE family protein [Pseudooceanicola sediminis]KAA2315038.1 SMP-30/gluconolactonase/LRE family protein [Puniceibacterium sp. HSS470]RII38852.1 SMP-30/gluconolactonase/LRE family protein [Pseudooceanicola sediminis]|tara:strand:+ start:39109 stop:39960 length:852 start_codon:yes stop_codon:yes gene_type:complete